jgi:hypothetical protein
MPNSETFVKVSFRLKHGSHGVVGEHLWAEVVGDGRFRLRNTPFHVYGVSFLDVVFAKPRRGQLVFSGVSIRGGHSTFWIQVTPAGDKAFSAQWQRLARLGCGYESHGSVYAVDVPPAASIDEVYAVLEDGEAAGVWLFEEAHRGHLVLH